MKPGGNAGAVQAPKIGAARFVSRSGMGIAGGALDVLARMGAKFLNPAKKVHVKGLVTHLGSAIHYRDGLRVGTAHRFRLNITAFKQRVVQAEKQIMKPKQLEVAQLQKELDANADQIAAIEGSCDVEGRLPTRSERKIIAGLKKKNAAHRKKISGLQVAITKVKEARSLLTEVSSNNLAAGGKGAQFIVFDLIPTGRAVPGTVQVVYSTFVLPRPAAVAAASRP